MLFLQDLGGGKDHDLDAQKPYVDTGRAIATYILVYEGIVFGSLSGVRFRVQTETTFDLTRL